MSDTSQGPGWWQASDGKWYPPESFPTDWTAPAADAVADTAAEVPEVAAAAEPVVAEPPAVAPEVAAPVAAAPVDVGAAIDALPGTEQPPPVAAPPVAAAPPVTAPAPAAPPAAVDPALDATQHIPTVDATMMQQAAPAGWVDPAAAPGVPPAPGVPIAPDNLPPASSVASVNSSIDAPAAIAGLIGGVAMVASPFLDWAAPTQDPAADIAGQLSGLGVANLAVPTLTGFDSNGIGVLIAGVVAALCGILLLAGTRHVMVKAGMALAGLAGIALFAFSFIDIGDLPITINGTELEGITFDPQIGLWVAVAGGVVATIGGLIAKSD
jgi:hypothetical protein